jgi:choline dehydrogenase-like flavoprotein
MTGAEFVPDQPDQVEWDVAVIGTGMGGATTGYELARLGHRVLFIEKGMFLHAAFAAGGYCDFDASDDSPASRLRGGRWPVRLRGQTDLGKVEFYAPLGCGTGGSTALYAAGLERFAPADFAPRANFPDAPDSTLPERWPIGYEELRPYYERAEQLFRVCGTPDPLDRGGPGPLRPPPPLSPRDAHFEASFRRLGLHPYRVHAGLAFVEGCTGCATGPCPRACKSDAAWICLLPALREHGAAILPECEVVELVASADAVTGLRCRRRDGRELTLRAKVVVLAAGAYMTPALLLKSRSAAWPQGLANRSGQVGRHLMFHVSEFIAVSPLQRLSGDGAQKTLAINDFYLRDGRKLGTFQSAGAAIDVGRIMQYMRDSAERDPRWWVRMLGGRSRWWRKATSPFVRLAALLLYHGVGFKHAAVWATIVEDLPYHDNRIVDDPDSPNGMRFEYRSRDELRERVHALRRQLRSALKPHRLMVLSSADNLNYGHVCGTCRFGDDPLTSVLDRDNRAHGVENLYVVDASFFPSSGGTNPSLTIAANALRVADRIHERFGVG